MKVRPQDRGCRCKGAALPLSCMSICCTSSPDDVVSTIENISSQRGHPSLSSFDVFLRRLECAASEAPSVTAIQLRIDVARNRYPMLRRLRDSLFASLCSVSALRKHVFKGEVKTCCGASFLIIQPRYHARDTISNVFYSAYSRPRFNDTLLESSPRFKGTKIPEASCPADRKN